MSEIRPDSVIARSPSVVTSVVDGEILMMSIEEGRYFGLDDVAGDVWERLATPRSFAELVGELEADYDAGRAAIESDLRALIADMRARAVVVVRDPAAG